MSARCAMCQNALPEPATRAYCSNACRQRAYRQRMAHATAKPADRIVSNLPAERDSFIGRQQELITVDRLRRKHRLITLTGSAGAGKTRLAIAAASRADRTDTDRVLLVELGPVTDEHLIEQTVAAAAGLVEHSDESIMETIVATLRTMRVLVLLDNCEHVLESCAKLADTLLSRCPSLRILATSREPLRITGEVTVRVDGLAIGQDNSVNALRRTESVRLFVERAKEMVPDFRLPAAETHAVAALCTRLDGIPLAIELAAKWVPVLPVSEICARLDSRFDLLVLGGRTRPNRQRSLWEAIDWSYQLLATSEQRALRRLSVFAGGFDLDAAAAVCGTDADTTLNMISRLQAKSLLTPFGRTGFRMLESIRLYAMRRLTEADESTLAFDALTTWLTDLVSAFVTRPMSVPRAVHRQTTKQVESWRVACEWAASAGDPRHLAMAIGLAVAEANLGFIADARKVLRGASPDGTQEYRCTAMDRAAWFAGFQGDFAEALGYAEQSLAIARELADPALITNCLTTLACVQQMTGKLDLALTHRAECVRMVRELGQPHATATCLVHLAWSLLLDGDHARAHALASESLAICREIDSTTRTSEALNVLGAIALRRNDIDAAEQAFNEVLAAGPKYPHNLPNAIEGLAVAAVMRGDHERALQLYDQAQPMRRATGVIGDPFWQRTVTDALGQVPYTSNSHNE
ncbi:tetratricopeptide repeat protein [Kibdelosporangium aridum]|nr:tetratricopeptide repeat protein [Kibdelosporangium aridum]